MVGSCIICSKMGKSSRSLRASSFGEVVTATPSWYRWPSGAPETPGLLGYAGFERGLERVADRLELDPVEDLLVEAAHDQPLGLTPREPAGHAVEELVAVDLADRRPVRAAHVIRLDLEARDGVGVRLIGEEQVAVLLIGVCLLGVLGDADHPAPDRGRPVAKRTLEREVGGRGRGEVRLQRVVVEMLVAVGEVRAGHPRRGPLTGEVVLDPYLALLRPEAAGDPIELRVAPDSGAVGREVPRLGREALNGDVFELRALLDEELRDRVRVAREPGVLGHVFLDDREAAAFLRDDEEAPEESAPFDRVDDPHVERLLDLDALRHAHEQAVLPLRRVVSGELLVRPDERAEKRVVLQALEDDPVGRALDLDPTLAHMGDRGGVDVEHAARPLDTGCPVRRERIRVEAAQVGEAPVLVPGGREWECLVALEDVGPGHGAYRRCSIRSLPSGSVKNAIWQTPVSRMSPRNSTPFSSSSARRLATSSTCRAG